MFATPAIGAFANVKVEISLPLTFAIFVSSTLSVERQELRSHLSCSLHATCMRLMGINLPWSFPEL